MKLIGLTGDMSVAAALYLVEVLLHIVDILLHFVSILLQLLDQCGEFCAGSTERRHTETSLMTSHTGFFWIPVKQLCNTRWNIYHNCRS